MKKAPFPLEERRFPAAAGRLSDRIAAAGWLWLPVVAIFVVHRATLALTALLAGHLARFILLLLAGLAISAALLLLPSLTTATALLALRPAGLVLLPGPTLLIGLALLTGLAAILITLLALRPAGLLLLAGLATALAVGALLAHPAGLLLLLTLPVLAGLLAGLIVHRRSPHALHRTRISAAAGKEPGRGTGRSRKVPQPVAWRDEAFVAGRGMASLRSCPA